MGMGRVAIRATGDGIRATGQLGRFVLLCLGVWLHAANSLVTATALPAIVADIGGVPYVAWTITLYQIGAIVAGAATALLARRPRHRARPARRRPALWRRLRGRGLAPSMGLLLVARLLQGLGGGTLLALGYVAIQQWFAEHLWGRLFGVQALIWAVGSLIGPLLGSVFVELGFWRGIFWSFALQAGLLWLLTAGLASRAGTGSVALPAAADRVADRGDAGDRPGRRTGGALRVRAGAGRPGPAPMSRHGSTGRR